MHRRVAQALGSILAGMLMLAGTQASAQTPAPPAFHRGDGFARPLFGTIASVTNGTLVLTTWTGRSVALQTTAATRVLSRQQVGPADLRTGDLVRLIATKAADGTLSARTLNDIPASLVRAPAGRPGAAPLPGTAPRGIGLRGRGEAWGLWAGPRGTVVIAGRLTAVRSGAVSIALPAGAPLSVAVPPAARITRLISLPLSGLAPGTHVIVRAGRPHMPQQSGSATGAARTLTAIMIFVVPAGAR